MLDHIGQRSAAERIERSVGKTLQDGIGLTRDLGGSGTTETLTARLIANM
jgi:isocitrate dehydrogenase (NAD+)